MVEERERLRVQATDPAAKPELKDSKKEDLMAEAWMEHVSLLTLFVASSLLAVMVACTALRTHLFIWTVFSPKYLYAMAWSIGWHWGVSLGLGGLLYAVRGL